MQTPYAASAWLRAAPIERGAPAGVLRCLRCGRAGRGCRRFRFGRRSRFVLGPAQREPQDARRRAGCGYWGSEPGPHGDGSGRDRGCRLGDFHHVASGSAADGARPACLRLACRCTAGLVGRALDRLRPECAEWSETFVNRDGAAPRLKLGGQAPCRGAFWCRHRPGPRRSGEYAPNAREGRRWSGSGHADKAAGGLHGPVCRLPGARPRRATIRRMRSPVGVVPCSSRSGRRAGFAAAWLGPRDDSVPAERYAGLIAAEDHALIDVAGVGLHLCIAPSARGGAPASRAHRVAALFTDLRGARGLMQAGSAFRRCRKRSGTALLVGCAAAWEPRRRSPILGALGPEGLGRGRGAGRLGLG